jgi:hypothetical protein
METRRSYYRVVGDTQLGTSPISIHWRRVKSGRVSDYKNHLRCALRVHATDLIPDWGFYDTNTRHAQGHTSPITKKSETRLSYCIVDLSTGWGHYGTNKRHTLLDARLLFHAPIGILVAGCILELARI